MKYGLNNLDSLTDIVSNSIGMLVLLSLITVFQTEKKVYDVEIPIEQETELAPAFFVCKDEAVVFLDDKVLYPTAIIEAGSGNTSEERGFPLGQPGLEGKVGTVNKDIKVLMISSKDTTAWDGLSRIDEGESDIRKALDSLDPKKQFAFFFVYDEAVGEEMKGSGFEAFEKAKAHLKARGVSTGWLPVDEDNPPYLCVFSESLPCRYLPSYRQERLDSPSKN